MVSVVADNSLIQRSILRIAALAEAAGAEFHRDLVVKCIDGTMSIEAPPDSVGSILIRLPWDSLVPIPPFEIAVAGDDLTIATHDAGITADCVAMMEAMLELYNLTHKLAAHRRTSPWSLLASHPELLSDVMTARQPRLSEAVVSGNPGELEQKSFFNSRLFSYTEAREVPMFPVLLPILDAMNHHAKGERFYYDDPSERGQVLRIARSEPLIGIGNECFAFYGNHDCNDTWMSYGFVDEATVFLRSRPMKIDLPGLGTIEIADIVRTVPAAALPPPIRDLRYYIPTILLSWTFRIFALLAPAASARPRKCPLKR